MPALLVAASSVSILSTDLYTPSLPHLPAYFGTDAETVQQTMMLNLLGYALGQLVHGPLSERFGRRPVMIAGMAAATVFSLACAAAWSIEALIVARAFQGLAMSAEAVIALAVIRDLYEGPSGARILAIFGMALALAPAPRPRDRRLRARVGRLARQLLSDHVARAGGGGAGVAAAAGNRHPPTAPRSRPDACSATTSR